MNIQDLVTDQLLSADLHLHQLGQVLAGLVLPPQESAAAIQYGTGAMYFDQPCLPLLADSVRCTSGGVYVPCVYMHAR